jgi:hypothetical protein
VLRIAHLRVLNELRRRGRRIQVQPDPQGLRVGGLPEPGPGPPEETWREHRRAIVREAVAALPPPQGQALSLAFLDDLTHKQISAFLDLPLGTTKTRIRAGIHMLRARLSPLLAAGLLVVGLIAAARLHERSRLHYEAVRLVTSSDVVPRRMVATSGPRVARQHTATTEAGPASPWRC